MSDLPVEVYRADLRAANIIIITPDNGELGCRLCDKVANLRFDGVEDNDNDNELGDNLFVVVVG